MKIDEIFHYQPDKNSPMWSCCRIRIFEGENETLVIATEIGENEGRSVTNSLQTLVPQVCHYYQLEMSRVIFLEHYNSASYGRESSSDKDTYDQVFFTRDGEPQWRRLQPYEVLVLQDILKEQKLSSSPICH